MFKSIYVCIFENGAEELKLRLQRGFFPAKGDDIKIRGKPVLVFLPSPVYLPFIVVVSLFLALLNGLKA